MIKLSCISSMANKRGTIVQFYMPIAESEAGQQSVTVPRFFSVPVLFLVPLFSGTGTKFPGIFRYQYQILLIPVRTFFRGQIFQVPVPFKEEQNSWDRNVTLCW